MKLRSLVQGESIPLFGLQLNETVEISLAVEAGNAALDALCVGLGEDGAIEGGYCVHSRHPMALGCHVVLLPSAYRGAQQSSVLVFKLANLVDAVQEIRIFFGAEKHSRLFEWGKGKVALKYRDTVFEWQFHGGRFGAAMAMESFRLKKEKGRWSAFLQGEVFPEPISRLSRMFRVRRSEIAAPLIRENRAQNESLAKLKKLRLLAPHLMPIHDLLLNIYENKKWLSLPTRCVVVFENTERMREYHISRHIIGLLENILGFSAYCNLEPLVDVLQIGQSALAFKQISLRDTSARILEALVNYVSVERPQYGRVIEYIRKTIYPAHNGGESKQVCSAERPVWVIWVVSKEPDDARLAEWQLRWSSKEPIFWSFMVMTGLKGPIKSSRIVTRQGGMGRDFRFFERMSRLEDHFVDNIDYCALSGLDGYVPDEFYPVLLEPMMGWVEEARKRGMLSK